MQKILLIIEANGLQPFPFKDCLTTESRLAYFRWLYSAIASLKVHIIDLLDQSASFKEKAGVGGRKDFVGHIPPIKTRSAKY